MSDYAVLVNSIFKIINVCIFIGLCAYLFYTKLLASLYKKMHEQQAIIPKLEQQRRGLHNQELNIDTAIEQQALIAKVLQKKIEGWSLSVRKMQEERQEEYKLMQRRMYQKAIQQEEYRAKHALYQQMIPSILTSTQDTLKKKYAHHEAMHRYVNTILQQVNKE